MKNVSAARVGALALLASVALAAPAAAQERTSSVGVGISGGSLGVGPEVNWRSRTIGVRGSASFLGFSRDVETDGVNYTGKLKLRSFGATVDYYPGGGGFRLSGGARINRNRVTLVATPSATTTVQVGDVTYTGAQIGRLDGRVSANKLSPTLTLGYGSGVGKGVYFGIDAGAMFQGSPKVRQLTATGPIASDPAFQAQLAKERAEIADDIKAFKVYPILQLGLGFRF